MRLKTITISGFTQRPDPATAKLRNVYVISARIEWDKWQDIDFESLASVDVIAALGRFEIARKLQRNGNMDEIEPLAASD